MRAFVERVRSCSVVLAIALMAAVPALAGTTEGARQLTSSRSLDTGLMAALNDTRAEHGLRPVRLSPALAAAARVHSVEMANAGFFAHESRDGGLFWKTPEIVAWAEGRPFAWIDDQIADVDRDWVRAHHDGPALLHQVDPAIGLVTEDFEALAAWAEAMN